MEAEEVRVGGQLHSAHPQLHVRSSGKGLGAPIRLEVRLVRPSSRLGRLGLRGHGIGSPGVRRSAHAPASVRHPDAPSRCWRCLSLAMVRCQGARGVAGASSMPGPGRWGGQSAGAPARAPAVLLLHSLAVLVFS